MKPSETIASTRRRLTGYVPPSQAYSVLSDENKRRQYDRFGKNAVNGSAGGHSGRGGGVNFQGQDAEEIFRTFFGGQDPFSMFFQEGLHGGGGPHGFGGQRVHVTQFGPGFSFSTFGNAPGMPGGQHPFMRHRCVVCLYVYMYGSSLTGVVLWSSGDIRNGSGGGQQQQQQAEQVSRFRIGGGNLLLILFLLWIMGVPLSYLWIALMIISYLGLV